MGNDFGVAKVYVSITLHKEIVRKAFFHADSNKIRPILLEIGRK